MEPMDYLQVSAAGGAAVATALRLGASLRRGVNPMAVGLGKRGLALLVESACPLLVGAWIYLVFRYALRLDLHLLPDSLHVRVLASAFAQSLGVVCVVAGVALLCWAYAAFGESWRIGVTDPGRLVTRGLYGLSRNPIFVALNLYCVGTFLINGTLVLLLVTVLQLAFIHYQILQEERFLRGRFGAEYAVYCARTPRYF